MSERTTVRPYGKNNPIVRIIAHEYERAAIHTWNNARVYKLAGDLGYPLPVICARAGMFVQDKHNTKMGIRLRLDTTAIRACIRKNLWPVHVSIHFDLMEREAAVKAGKGILFGPSNKIDAKMLAGTL